MAYRNSEWLQLGGGFSSDVDSVCDYQDAAGRRIVAAGRFQFVDGVHVRHVASWDGVAWSPMGAGFDGPVKALEVIDLGAGPTLFATGEFTHSGGASVSRIAQWTGSTWAPLGAGLTGAGYALHGADLGAGPRLYVGGSFQRAGALTANGIACWDGSSWSTLGSGAINSFGATGGVIALRSWNGQLFAGGVFTSMNGLVVNNVASWNGTTWSALGNGVSYPGGGVAVFALEVHDAGAGPELFVGGSFSYATVNNGSQRNLARWNGAAWGGTSGFAGADTWGVYSLKSYDEGGGPALYAGTRPNLETGTLERLGSSWTSFALFDGLPAELEVLMTNDGPVLFVGGSFRAGPTADSFLARWSGCAACPAPESYCTAGTTSQGCAPSIWSSGAPSASQSSGFTLHCANLDGQRSGLFFYGVNGQLNLPWHAGGSSRLCVRPPLQRSGVSTTGGTLGQCNGQLQLDLLAYLAAHPNSLGAPLTAGTQVRAQAWFRDPLAVGATGLSDALAWAMCP